MPVRIESSVAVVTGAASGIGRATALALAARGAHVALADIDTDGLRKVVAELDCAGARTQAHEVDVSNRDQVDDFARQVVAAWAAPSILVNNAGVGSMALFHEMDRDVFERVVLTNFFGVVNNCRSFLPAMLEQRRPAQIVNVASLAGLCPLPSASAYSASKHAVVGFSRSLRAELSGSGIGVTVVCPGKIRTNIASNARYQGSFASYGTMVDDDLQRRGKSVELVARHILRAIHKNRAIVVTPASARMIDVLQRHFPRLAALIARGLMRSLASDAARAHANGAASPSAAVPRPASGPNESIGP